VRGAKILAMAVLAAYMAMAAITVTPVTITGVEEQVSRAVGMGGFLVQKVWAGITFLATVGTILGIVYRAWIEEDRLKRAVFGTSVIIMAAGLALPFILHNMNSDLDPVACILHGWVGELIPNFSFCKTG